MWGVPNNHNMDADLPVLKCLIRDPKPLGWGEVLRTSDPPDAPDHPGRGGECEWPNA